MIELLITDTVIKIIIITVVALIASIVLNIVQHYQIKKKDRLHEQCRQGYLKQIESILKVRK